MPSWVLFQIVFLGTCGYALMRGGAPERLVSLAFLIAASLSMVLRQPGMSLIMHIPSWSQFQQIEIGVFVVDATLLIALIVLACTAQRFWPIWMAAMAAIIVLTHFAMLYPFPKLPWAYWYSEGLWSYPMQVLLAIATWRHQDRLKRCGADPSWRRSFTR